MGWKGQLVSEARNKRGHLVPVVGGLASQHPTTSRVQACTNERSSRLFQLGGAAFHFEGRSTVRLRRRVVFAGAFTSLQLEPHRFLKRRQLWRCLMQCCFGRSRCSNDEAVCLVDSVESHVPEEDDTRNVDIRTVRASNASELSPQAMARADWHSPHPVKSWPSRTTAFTSLVIWSTTL